MPSDLITGSSFMDRPELALSNLLAGHIRAAGTALFGDAEKLSPEERKKLSARLGLTGPAAGITDFITNPWVLIPLAATLVTRLPGAGLVDVTSATDAWSRFAGQWVPVLSAIAPAMNRFKGTKLYPLMQRVLDDFHGNMRSWFGTTGTEVEPGFDAAWRAGAKALGGQVSEAHQRELMVRLGALNQVGVGSGRVHTVAKARLEHALEKNTPEVWEDLNAGIPHDSLDRITPQKAMELLPEFDQVMPGYKPTPELEGMYKESRKFLDKIYASSMAVKEKVKDIIIAMPHIFGAPGHWDDASLDAAAEELAPYVEHYAPMITRMNPKEAAASWIRADGKSKISETTLRHMIKGISERTGTNRILLRKNGMVPNPDEFLAAGGNPKLAEYYRLRVRQGDMPFSLNAGFVLPQYAENMARVLAFSVRNEHGTVAGRAIEAELQALRSGDHPTLKAPLEVQRQIARFGDEVVVPALRGRLTPSQVSAAMSWNGFKATISNNIRDPGTKIGKAYRMFFDEKKAQAWADNIDTSPSYTMAAVSSKVAGYLHGSTLVANPLAASFNLLTIFTNLASTVGWKSATKGMDAAFREVTAYMGHRAAGMEAGAAFRKAFPEYHSMALELGSAEKQNFMDTLEGAYRQGFTSEHGGPVARGLAKFHQFFNFFGATEHVNRLTSYHASKDYALRTFKAGEQVFDAARLAYVPLTKENIPHYAKYWARDNVSRTQFGSDILQKPGFLADWNPVLRQFTTFPLRMADLVANAPPATWARLGLASGALYAGAKQFAGADLTRGLIMGGLPVATDPEYAPFAPMPLVSPALQLLGGAALATTGHPEYLQRSLPLLVPGGIPLSRAIGMVPGVGRTVAPLIGRQYVDDQHGTPDGRYPVYTSNGAAVGYFTVPQLMAKAVGLPNPDATAEQEITKFMIANRERVSAMKRSYMDALYNNDAADAQRIREQFEEAYPNMGGLPVKPSDVRALHMRRDVSRMERVLDTMPSDMRGQFLASIAVSMGANPEGFMGLLANGFQDGTTLDRDPYRAYNIESTKRRVSQGLHGVSAREKLRRAGQEPNYDYDRRRDSGTYLGGREENYLP